MPSKYSFLFYFALVATLSLTACNSQGGFALFPSPSPSSINTQTATITPSWTPTPSETPTPSDTPSPSPTNTNTPTATISPTFTPSDTPTSTFTPSITPSPTISPTPTIDFPDVVINVGSAHCRYGPGKAYLHAADLYEGDHGLVWNRNYAGTWLWVRFDKLHYACWVASSVTEINGDISNLSTYKPALPHSTLYEAPKSVAATRSGDQVIVTWVEVWMTEDDDRGYLIEARVCQNGYLIDMAVHTNGTSYTFLDEKKCTGESKGRLYAVEKHGYTDPVQIPWP